MFSSPKATPESAFGGGHILDHHFNGGRAYGLFPYQKFHHLFPVAHKIYTSRKRAQRIYARSAVGAEEFQRVFSAEEVVAIKREVIIFLIFVFFDIYYLRFGIQVGRNLLSINFFYSIFSDYALRWKHDATFKKILVPPKKFTPFGAV